jgi:uncharacterized protein YbbK (DUF523 family)
MPELIRPRVGISACLLGDEVRFDGGHKRDPLLTDVIGRLVEWVRVCPEVEIGMGTPREPLRLVRGADDRIRMVTLSGIDHTEAMKSWSRERVEQLANENLSGYVLKSNSPSCGLQDVKLFDARGAVERTGRGLFADALLTRFPELPVEEEGRLSDSAVRERFIARVVARHEQMGRSRG